MSNNARGIMARFVRRPSEDATKLRAEIDRLNAVIAKQTEDYIIRSNSLHDWQEAVKVRDQTIDRLRADLDRERMHRQAITNALVDVAKAVDALMEVIENG